MRTCRPAQPQIRCSFLTVSTLPTPSSPPPPADHHRRAPRARLPEGAAPRGVPPGGCGGCCSGQFDDTSPAQSGRSLQLAPSDLAPLYLTQPTAGHPRPHARVPVRGPRPAPHRRAAGAPAAPPPPRGLPARLLRVAGGPGQPGPGGGGGAGAAAQRVSCERRAAAVRCRLLSVTYLVEISVFCGGLWGACSTFVALHSHRPNFELAHLGTTSPPLPASSFFMNAFFRIPCLKARTLNQRMRTSLSATHDYLLPPSCFHPRPNSSFFYPQAPPRRPAPPHCIAGPPCASKRALPRPR